MRTTVVLACSALLVAGLGALAPLLAEDGPTATDPVVKALQEKVQKLERQVEYLRSREDATTRYVLAHQKRSEILGLMLDDAVRLGFTARALPAESRERVVGGLREFAAALVADLPLPTRAEAALLKDLGR
jgi:hypothetical protein